MWKSYVPASASLVGVEAVEVASDDGHWNGERENACDGTHHAHHLAQVAHRNPVSIANGGHGDDGPPEGVRNALNLRGGSAQFCVVDGRRKNEQTNEESHQKKTQTFQRGLKREHQHLQSNRVLGELEDAHEANDPQKGQRSTRLGAFTTHGAENVKEGDVVWHDGHDVDEVFEIFPEFQLVGTDDKAHNDLEGEPRGAEGLDDEEGVQKVGSFVFFAVRSGKDRQSLDAEENN